ncbi:MAG: hypothetical protein RLZZ399_1442 [Verrucomicrobiota bacterium]|jgi:signal transduction histidine kinase
MPRKQLVLLTLLIVLPALALALVSLASLRTQAEDAEREREKLAEKLARGVSEQFERLFSEVESACRAAAKGLQAAEGPANSLASPLVEAVWIMAKEGTLHLPRSPWKSSQGVQVDPKLQNALEEAEALEIRGEFPRAVVRYETLMASASQREAEAVLLNALARCRRKMGQLSDALALYGRLLMQHPATVSANGMPLAAVAALETISIESELQRPECAFQVGRDFLQKLLGGVIPASREQAAYFCAEMSALWKTEVSGGGGAREECERTLAILRNALAAEDAAEALQKLGGIDDTSHSHWTVRTLASGKMVGIGAPDSAGLRVLACLRTDALKTQCRTDIEQLLRYAGHFDYEIRDAQQAVWIAAKDGPLQPPVVRLSSARPADWGIAVSVPESPAIRSGARLRTLAAGGMILLLLLTLGASLYFLNATVRRTAELSALKTDFVSAVSHEMRTPLATIRMITEMFQLGRVTDPQMSEEYMETVNSEAERLTRLINKVLDFSRMDAGRKPDSFAVVGLGGIVRDAVKKFEMGLAEHREIRVEVEPDLPEVRVDEDAMVQALLNLLENAVKYSAAPAPIEVSLRSVGREVLLVVADEGIGIDPSQLGKIFERFYRCEDELTRKTTGTGIGLSIVKHIVEAHRGRIEVRSTPAEGSVFTIHLPLPSENGLYPTSHSQTA